MRVLIISFLAFLFSLPLVSAHQEAAPQTVVIHMRDNSYDPKNVSVGIGTTVIFENIGGEDHWPASNVHPTHELYPDFDSKKPITPNESWSFKFEKKGKWVYHDHLFPTITGTIEVGGVVEEDIFSKLVNKLRSIWSGISALVNNDSENSKKIVNTAFKEPAKYNLNKLQESFRLDCEPADQFCVSNAMKELTREYGPGASIGMLEYLLKEKRIPGSVNDHQLAHEIGRETARIYGVNSQAFLLCPMSSFNGGCQHGFFEYVLGRTDTATEAANLICDSLGENYSEKFKFYCYHGVGHGIMMQQAYNLDTALQVCDSLEEKFAQEGCWQGVFMENVNAVLTNYAERKDVFSDEDPLAPCDKINEKYRQQCYLNHSGYLMLFFANNMKEAAKSCLQALGWIPSCLQTLGLMTSNSSWQSALYPDAAKLGNVKTTWELCKLFPQKYINYCVQGAIDNINNFDEFDVERANAFCSEIGASFQDNCWRSIGRNLRNNATSTEKVASSCLELNKAGQNLCLSAAGI